MKREGVVVIGVRPAIGAFGGAPKSEPPTKPGNTIAREALRRAGL
ncbi:hypothetical protein [Paraburkholderia fungorum]